MHAPSHPRRQCAVGDRDSTSTKRERAARRRREREVVRRVEADAARVGAGRRNLRRRPGRGEGQYRRAIREIGQHVTVPVRRRRERGVRAAAVPRGGRRRRAECTRPADDLFVRHDGDRLARRERSSGLARTELAFHAVVEVGHAVGDARHEVAHELSVLPDLRPLDPGLAGLIEIPAFVIAPIEDRGGFSHFHVRRRPPRKVGYPRPVDLRAFRSERVGAERSRGIVVADGEVSSQAEEAVIIS